MALSSFITEIYIFFMLLSIKPCRGMWQYQTQAFMDLATKSSTSLYREGMA